MAADSEPADLEPGLRAGLRMFRESCIVCHEGRQAGPSERAAAEAADASGQDHDEDHEHEYDRAYTAGEPGPHDSAPALEDATAREALGARLYQRNCAICHAADGTGKNWIGSFLQPNRPDLTDPALRDRLADRAIEQAILEGLPGTSMPAFKSALSRAEAAAIAAYVQRAFHR